MQLFDHLLSTYGTLGLATTAAILFFFIWQVAAALRFARIAGYKNNRRKKIREEGQPVSLIIPMFTEDYNFLEYRLPAIFEQDYPSMEVVIVYVGLSSDFLEDLTRLRQHYPHLIVTRVHYDPRFPISRKMALNIGIKAAHNDCMIFSSTDVIPRSPRWISLMAKGFTRGDIVLGYCAAEHQSGLLNGLMRMGRLLRSASWMHRATIGKPYRGTLHNFGFTRSVYFNQDENKGFHYLGLNIGEEDLFLQQCCTSHNTSLIITPAATVEQKLWGGLRWWVSQLCYYGAATRFYAGGVKWHFIGEQIARVAFFATTIYGLITLPNELRYAVGGLLLLRYLILIWMFSRMTRRLGERGLLGPMLIYDLIGPLWNLLLALLLLRKDKRVWR